MSCLSSRNNLYLDPMEKTYIDILLSRVLDLPKSFDSLDCELLTDMECLKIGHSLKNHIDNNRIFEMNVNGFKKPYVLNNDDSLPTTCKAMSISSIQLVSKLAKFLLYSKRGVELRD